MELHLPCNGLGVCLWMATMDCWEGYLDEHCLAGSSVRSALWCYFWGSICCANVVEVSMTAQNTLACSPGERGEVLTLNPDQVLQELVLEAWLQFRSVPSPWWDSPEFQILCYGNAQKHFHVTSCSFSRTKTSLVQSWGFLTPSAFGSPASPSPAELSVPVEAWEAEGCGSRPHLVSTPCFTVMILYPISFILSGI